jgi:hypothetical protein
MNSSFIGITSQFVLCATKLGEIGTLGIRTVEVVCTKAQSNSKSEAEEDAIRSISLN